MRRWLALLLLPALAGCDEMARQPRDDVYRASPLFENGAAMQAPPPGTVARDAPAWDAAVAERPPMTPALLSRGRERYRIFCQPCHDASGSGHGIIPARGFPQPPDFNSERLRQASSRTFVDVIGHGHGAMFAYGDRVPPRDRWAIAAYMRALQLSQHAPAADLAAEDRARLEAPHGR